MRPERWYTPRGVSGRPTTLVFVLLMTSGVFSACRTPEPVTTDIAVFVDWTEVEEHNGSILLAEDERLDRLLESITTRDISDTRLNGGSITFYPINAHGLLGSGRHASLKLGNLNQNKFARLQEIDQFYADAREAFEDFLQDEVDASREETSRYRQSFIVQPLCQYLATVDGAPQTNHRRHVVVFSDLLEHSSTFSFYLGTPTPDYLRTHRDDVADRFMEECGVIQAPVPVEYKIVRHALLKGAPPDISMRQYEAQHIWNIFFQKLGLHEDSTLAL